MKMLLQRWIRPLSSKGQIPWGQTRHGSGVWALVCLFASCQKQVVNTTANFPVDSGVIKFNLGDTTYLLNRNTHWWLVADEFHLSGNNDSGLYFDLVGNGILLNPNQPFRVERVLLFSSSLFLLNSKNNGLCEVDQKIISGFMADGEFEIYDPNNPVAPTVIARGTFHYISPI
jgi:hypothetical protein